LTLPRSVGVVSVKEMEAYTSVTPAGTIAHKIATYLLPIS